MIETPTLVEMEWGSDAIAELLTRLDLPYVALVPGSSFRGLHDSFVNYLGERDPKILVCLHEEHTVAIAHGYAKVTGKPLLAVIHANVGLMHASMAVYDAWCDRLPVLVLGANGPHDASKRRPWIDWIHTSRDQAALVRHYTKWDDEPGSVTAAIESITRAYQIALTPPYGPTYVVLDVATQEEQLAAPVALPDLKRYEPPALPQPSAADTKRVLDIMRNAEHPVILIGRVSTDVTAFDNRIALAEALDARVITDFKMGVGFPTDHALHVGQSAVRLTADGIAAFRTADAILSLEAVDLGGALKSAFGSTLPATTIVNCSIDRYLHNGWSMDHQSLPAADVSLAIGADELVSALLAELGNPKRAPQHTNGVAKKARTAANGGVLGFNAFCEELTSAFAGRETCFIRLPLGANYGGPFAFHHPLDYLGGDGGGGIGSGPGLAVGAALALRGSGRLPVAVFGDGDYLMGLTALWTAVANDIPLLVIVANNHSYNNDVEHQDHMARQRKRPVERKWIGQMIAEPAPDLAMLARGQGAIGIGPIVKPADVQAAIAEGIEHVEAGKVCVIDIFYSPEVDAVKP